MCFQPSSINLQSTKNNNLLSGCDLLKMEWSVMLKVRVESLSQPTYCSLIPCWCRTEVISSAAVLSQCGVIVVWCLMSQWTAADRNNLMSISPVYHLMLHCLSVIYMKRTCVTSVGRNHCWPGWRHRYHPWMRPHLSAAWTSAAADPDCPLHGKSCKHNQPHNHTFTQHTSKCREISVISYIALLESPHWVLPSVT